MKTIGILNIGSISRVLGAILFIACITIGLPAQTTVKSAREVAWIGNTYSGLVSDSAGNLYGTP